MALTTDFVASVRRQGSISSTMTAADIMAVGDEEIQARFIALLESVRQNYLVRELVASPDARGRVPLPIRASGAAVRSVQLQVSGSWRSLPQRQMEDPNALTQGQPGGYYLDAGSIALLPTGTSGTLRIRYCARPGRMCLDTDTSLAVALTAVGAPGPTTTALTAAFVGSLANCDIVSSGPAHQAKAVGVALGGAQPSLTVNNVDLQEQPIAGDFVALADRSPFVPLPEELFSALVHSTAANILLAMAYLEEASAQEGKAQACIQAALPMLLPRNEGNPQRVTGGLRRALGMR